MVRRALIVVTSTERYPNENKATGLWLGEAAHFYNELIKEEWHIDFVSPRGGYTPIDPVSLQMGPNEVDWKWYADEGFRHRLGHTHKPSEINPEHYDLIYFAGGHGVVFDFPDNKELIEIARHIYEKGGVVSSVCHGVVGLLNIKLSTGDLLIKGKKITGFSNSEEKEAGLEKHVPFLTETELKARGALYSQAENWKEYVIVDGRLITGQNPGSSAAVGKAVLQYKW